MSFSDAHTVLVRDFVYDGEAPDAFFVVGTEGDVVDPAKALPLPYPSPRDNRRAVHYEDDDIPVLSRFDGSKDQELQLPHGVTADNVR